MPEFQLKWGFFGAGKCSHDFASALQLLPKEKHELIGIASRSLEKAKSFAESLQFPKYFDSYEELAKDSEIDIVYIGTVNSEHFSQAKLAIGHGKHVLCEKAMCLNYKEMKEIVDLARSNRVFLMEGFWTNFFPAMKKVVEELETETIGKIIHTTIEIGGPVDHLERFRCKEIGGGLLLNYGVYGIMLACKFLGEPDGIVATGHLSPEGVDESAVIAMSYKNGAQMSTIILSGKARMPSEFRIIGTLGTIKVCFPFWAPQHVITPKDSFHFDLPEAPNSTQFNYPNASGFTYEAEEVRRCISEGLLESPLMPLSLSISIIKIADEARRQIGVTYSQDL